MIRPVDRGNEMIDTAPVSMPGCNHDADLFQSVDKTLSNHSEAFAGYFHPLS